LDQVLISIVVCTFNRSALLHECLTRLAIEAGPGTASEVLVVDNNSSDATAEVTEPFCARYPWFRCVVEVNQGLAHARNRGWQEACGKYVAFIDDDARPCMGWVKAIRDFAGAHPDVAAFGGPYIAFSPAPMPDWFPQDYGCWDLGREARPLTTSEFLNGTNMVFRRNIFESIGGFDNTLGMRGGELGYGEETDLMMRMHARGMKIHYVPSIIVEHAILEYKMSLRWLLKSAYRNGRSGPRFHDERRGDTRVRHFFRVVRGAFNALYVLASAKERHAKTAIYRALAPLMWQIGYLVALLQRTNRGPR
jgi:GT2 family glycosyltransferase